MTVSVTVPVSNVSEVTEPADSAPAIVAADAVSPEVVSWLSADPTWIPFDVTVVVTAVGLSAVVGEVTVSPEDVSDAVAAAVCPSA